MLKETLIIVIIAFVVMLSNCSTDLSGGTTSTENGKVMGVVKNELDSLISNCEVILIPSEFNPLIDSGNQLYKDTTNDNGEYLFDPVKSGVYNLICKDTNMSININVSVKNDSIHIDDQILKKVSSLKVKLSGDMPFMNNVYFQGTTFIGVYDSTDSSFYFDELPYGLMPFLILENSEGEIVKEGIELTNGQDQSIEIDTNSFIVDNRSIGSGTVTTIDASYFKRWAGVNDDGLFYGLVSGSGWSKTDTGASPWLQDSIIKIEANEKLKRDWALIKTNLGTLFYEEGTYWSVEEQLYVGVDGQLPSSMLISDKSELILSYNDQTIIGRQELLGDTLKDIKWDYIPAGGYLYIAGYSDTLFLVNSGNKIYRRLGDELPIHYYTMPDSITGLLYSNEDLYIGTINGFYKYDFDADSLEIISVEFETKNVRSIIKNGNETVCAISGDKSIIFYNSNVLLYTPQIDSVAIFYDMTFTNENQLWISAGSQGIYTIQPVE